MIKPVLGVILAGGQARRLGGGDKAMTELAGKPLLAHAMDRLAPQVAQIVINANGDPARFDSFPAPVVADTVEGFAGPLAGVLRGSTGRPNTRPAASGLSPAQRTRRSFRKTSWRGCLTLWRTALIWPAPKAMAGSTRFSGFGRCACAAICARRWSKKIFARSIAGRPGTC